MGEPTNAIQNLNKLQIASHCGNVLYLHESKQALDHDYHWHGSSTHLKPSVWICCPSESVVPAPRCWSCPPGCASSQGFSFWSFPALNASWPGWKSAPCFSNQSGSENQSAKIRSNSCNRWTKGPFQRFIMINICFVWDFFNHNSQRELTGLTPMLSSFRMRACSISGRTSFLMLLLLFFRTAGVAACFFFGADADLYSVGFFSAKLLDSVNTN